MVKHRDRYKKTFTHALKLLTGERPPANDNVNVYYWFHEKYIEIFTRHFSQFIIYAENSSLQMVIDPSPLQCCANSAELLLFGKWRTNFILEVSIVMPSL